MSLGKLRPHSLLRTVDVRNALGPGWSTQRTRRLLKRLGAARKLQGRLLYTTPARIASMLPESLEALYERSAG